VVGSERVCLLATVDRGIDEVGTSRAFPMEAPTLGVPSHVIINRVR